MSQGQAPSRVPMVGLRNVEENGPPIMVPASMLSHLQKGRRAAYKMDLEATQVSVKKPINGEGSPGSISLDFWEAAKHRQDDLTYRTIDTDCGGGYLLPWVASGRNRQERPVLQGIVLELPNGEGFRVWTRSKRHVFYLAFWALPWTDAAEHGSPLAFLVKHLGEEGAAAYLCSPVVKTKAGGIKIKAPYRASLEHPAVKEWHRLAALQEPIKQDP